MDTTAPQFVVHDATFEAIIGPNPSARLVAQSEDGSAVYHEACIYHPATRSIFVTSNQLLNSNGDNHILLSRIYVDDTQSDGPRTESVTPTELSSSFLNGGINYGDDILLCAQGSTKLSDPIGLVVVSSSNTQEYRTLLTSFYDIPFNSVNDVVVHPEDGSIWFTDPCYGYHQGIRPPPQLPNQVYRFDPATKSVRAVADGFVRPNGICFSPDAKTVYVTDTGAIHGSPEVPFDPAGPSHIYAFDLADDNFLTRRRLFAYAPGKIPDGIKCDTKGNVYSGCADGINVWNTTGVLLGVVEVKGGVANFCFGEQGRIYACNETKFWEVQLNGTDVKGALLGL